MRACSHDLLVVVMVLASVAVSAEDRFVPALNDAKSKIFDYQMAKLTGDPQQIRRATLSLQEDPLAIRRVNSTPHTPESDAFNTELNKDIKAIQTDTKETIYKRMESNGIERKRVEFFEATNPTKPGERVKVGQDWDMTIRVDGRDLPTRISQPIAHDSYYEAATGNKPPPRSDPVARSEYRKAADHFAEQQSLAVTDYQYKEAYGGSQAEGTRILTGPKDARLRDPTQISEVMEFKSNEARNLAEELRGKGMLESAVGRDLEQMRQATKQFDKQVVPRVEAMKNATVPQELKDAMAMMKQVDDGTVSPEKVREQLKQKFDLTPEEVIRRSAQLVEASQSLKGPDQRGEAPPDVFTENVLDRLAQKKLVNILERVDKGELTSEQAQDMITKIEADKAAKLAEAAAKADPATAGAPDTKPVAEAKPGADSKPAAEASPAAAEAKFTAEPAPATGGTRATTVNTFNNALTAIGFASNAAMGVEQEVQRALKAGEDPSRARAVGDALLEATMLPGIVRGVENGMKVGKEELDQGKRLGRSDTETVLNGWARIGRDLASWSLGSQIAKEEIAAEEARARKEGRDASFLASWSNATLRGLGEVFLINSVARGMNSLTEEEVILRGNQDYMRAFAQAKLVENLRTLPGITRDMLDVIMNGDITDPTLRSRLQAAIRRYQNARTAMDNLADMSARNFGANDPFTRAVRGSAGRLPAPPTADVVMRSIMNALIEVPDVTGLNPQAAGKILIDAGLTPVPVDAPWKPGNFKPLMIYNQEPAARTAVARNASITFMFSSGKDMRTKLKVPLLVDLTKDEAESKLAGLKLKAEPKPGEDKPPRTAKKHQVYKQSPQADVDVFEGETIHFDYYAGVLVGKYEGLTKDAVEAAIAKDGFAPKVYPGDRKEPSAAEHLVVYEQTPKTGVYLWFDDPVEAKYYRFEEGFQDGDGALVDARFAAAKVSDGAPPPQAKQNLPSAGPRTQIVSTSISQVGSGSKALVWVIRKYSDAATPKNFIAESSKSNFVFTGNSSSGTNISGTEKYKITIKDRQLSPTIATGTAYSWYEHSVGNAYHTNTVIYRDVFMIMFTHTEPVAEYDFTNESASMLKKSKELIDKRFPAN